MSRDKKRLRDYLNHILEAIARIERYVEDINELEFVNNELIQDAVIRNIEIIGEASRNIEKHYPDYAQEHPEVPFSLVYEMRNAVAHGYFKIDYEVVWKTLERDIPAFENSILVLLKEFKNSYE